MTFAERVLNIVASIPEGTTMTYQEVATEAGSPGASRVVGSIMSANTNTDIPCHRVVRSDGTVGGYNGLQGVSKKELLEQEGVTFVTEK